MFKLETEIAREIRKRVEQDCQSLKFDLERLKDQSDLELAETQFQAGAEQVCVCPRRIFKGFPSPLFLIF